MGGARRGRRGADLCGQVRLGRPYPCACLGDARDACSHVRALLVLVLASEGEAWPAKGAGPPATADCPRTCADQVRQRCLERGCERRAVAMWLKNAGLVEPRLAPATEESEYRDGLRYDGLRGVFLPTWPCTILALHRPCTPRRGAVAYGTQHDLRDGGRLDRYSIPRVGVHYTA